MSGLVLLRPWWLLALVPVAALALWLWRHRAAGEWAAVIDPPLLAAMRRLGHLHAGAPDAAPFLACAASALLALALAGPADPARGRRAASSASTPSSSSSTSRPRSRTARRSPTSRPPPRRCSSRPAPGRSASWSTPPTATSPPPRPATPRASRA